MSTKASHGLLSIKAVTTRAEIYLEDSEEDEEGASVRFVFPEGFNPKSAAHQLCNVIRQYLDDLAESGHLTKLDDREDVGDMALADAELASIRNLQSLTSGPDN